LIDQGLILIVDPAFMKPVVEDRIHQQPLHASVVLPSWLNCSLAKTAPRSGPAMM
jgi:hypothetical protein